MPDTSQALDKYLLDELTHVISYSLPSLVTLFLECLLSARPQARFLDSSCDKDAARGSGCEVIVKELEEGDTFRCIISFYLNRNLVR